MKKVKLNDKYIYIDDSNVDEKETGVFIKKEGNKDLEKTQEIKIEKKSSLDDTLTNVWGSENE